MSWNYENPKRMDVAIDMMSISYGAVTCECAGVEHEGITWYYDPNTNWYTSKSLKINPNPPAEVVTKMFNFLKMWWATQLDCVNMINE